MNIEDIRTYCLDKKAVAESFPFDSDTLVFKVGKKMFALTGLNHNPLRINLKCNPEKAILLREQYPQITPAFHMNKKHWNSVLLDNSLPPDLIKELIDHSYELVVKAMTKKERMALE